MRLSELILTRMEVLLKEWESAALTIVPGLSGEDRKTLRDEAEDMLKFVARDIESPQSDKERDEKSKGQTHAAPEVAAAQSHGAGRMHLGLSPNQLVLELSALRASVTRLWADEQKGLQTDDIAELIRFNEAVDELLDHAITSFSEQKAQETHLFQMALSASPDPSGIFDTKGRLMYANRAMAKAIGVPLDQAVGRSPFDLNLPSAANLQDAVERTLSTGQCIRREFTFNSTHRQQVSYECQFVPILDKNGEIEVIVNTSRDVTERKASEYQVWKNANFDELTGIPNRRLFLDRLEQPLKESDRKDAGFALLFIDLDRFKEANDQLGHSAGDLLLKRVADRISACVRDMDTFARLGGDEFTVILKDIQDKNKIETIANNLLARLAKPFQIHAHQVHISGSIGITVFPQDGIVSDTLMRNADQAMYAAKQRGGNCYKFYDRPMQRTESQHSKLARELQLALAEDQLAVFYQPIIDLTTGSICQAEALLRWNHPQRGLLTPVTFISIADQIGVAGAINAFVLGEAVSHSREWKTEQGTPFPISVNESPTSFFNRALVADWRSRIEHADMSGSAIMLELTENSLTNACASSPDLLKGLGEKDIRLAIDDFGAGQFSLASLRDCGIDCLKIDQTIVQAIEPGGGGDKTLVEAIISMAHSMGLKVIAEGVETDEQLRYLTKAGCDYAQGFLFSKPLPQKEFHALFRAS